MYTLLNDCRWIRIIIKLKLMCERKKKLCMDKNYLLLILVDEAVDFG